jgi:hypothetical protein
MNQEVKFLRNARVGVESLLTSKGKPQLGIVVNDQFRHVFPTTSRFSKALTSTTLADIENRLNRGHYLFVGDQLADFRDGEYDGFVHEDESIIQMVEHIGVMTRGTKRPGVQAGWGQKSEGGIILGSKWSDGMIEVPTFGDGGKFRTEVSFVWNPFSQFVNSTVEAIRLLCSNGMTASTDLINTKIPLINRWMEHLDIASVQIQNKTRAIFMKRMVAMSQSRASVADVKFVADHAKKRWAANSKDLVARQTVDGIFVAANPVFHLSDIYQDGALSANVVGSQLPSHLTQFDVYNLVTELRSHTVQVDDSLDFSLDKFANELVFNRKDDTKFSNRYHDAPRLSSFSDPEMAFFGAIS